MKTLRLAAIALALMLPLHAGAGDAYDTFFTEGRLRIDLIFAGNARQQEVFLDCITAEPAWSGSRTNLVPAFDYGEYTTEVRTPGGELIFSRGFSSLFQEWRSTAEAGQVNRAYTNSAWIPMPRGEVRFSVLARNADGSRSELLSFTIDPQDKAIARGAENSYKVCKWLDNGPIENKVDLCIVAEGYTAAEMEKFYSDVERLSGYLFGCEPFKSRKGDFNIWVVESVSEESGTDMPHMGIWRNTVASSNFYTFGIDRYLTAPDHKKVASIASAVPHDALYVVVNHPVYGGGGIYNYYALSSSDHPDATYVFPHEFGHSFAGLGDEYYEKGVAYENMYPAGVEPWEPNITTLTDFASKWEDMISPGTPVPTPNDPSWQGKVGLFEGGGYVAKGVWRPWYDCRMKSNKAPGFCPVCQRAINMMIDYYCK